MSLDHIRLSQQDKDRLIRLKARTGIQHWNVLCRWALCTSLAEEANPPTVRLPADSSVEMSWKVFGGQYQDVYLALLRARAHRSGLGTDDESLATLLHLHLNRGIGYLAGDRSVNRIEGLIAKAVGDSDS